MEVAKDEALMPCRAHFAFLSQHCFSVGKAPVLGDFFTSLFPKPAVLQERTCPCPRAMGHSHDLPTFPAHKPLRTSVIRRRKRLWEEPNIFFQN